jgi:hypothetical protein
MQTTIDTLQIDLFVAEQALSASLEAVETQGKGGLAWALFKARAERVRLLRERLALAAPAHNRSQMTNIRRRGEDRASS